MKVKQQRANVWNRSVREMLLRFMHVITDLLVCFIE